MNIFRYRSLTSYVMSIAVLVVSLAALGLTLYRFNNTQTLSALATSDIDPSTLNFINDLDPATNYYPWNDWYLVNGNQPEGYRLLNWWSSTSYPNNLYTGQSLLNARNNIATLPSGPDFFYLWQCLGKYGEKDPSGNPVDPNCYNQSKYLEILSFTTNDTLAHWARGSGSAWEVYYDASKIGGFVKCDGDKLRTATNPLDSTKPLDLTKSEYKKALSLKLSSSSSKYYVSSPVCAVVFTDNYNQNKNKVIDSRYGMGPSRPLFETGNWIVITINHVLFADNFGNDIIHAENIYLTDNYKSSDRFTADYCRAKNPNDTFRCVDYNRDGKKESLKYSVSNKEYKTFGFEEYWMRKVQSSGKKNPQGVSVKDKFGFGALKWWDAHTIVDWDKIYTNGTPYNGDVNHPLNQTYKYQRCNLGTYNTVSDCVDQ